MQNGLNFKRTSTRLAADSHFGILSNVTVIAFGTHRVIIRSADDSRQILVSGGLIEATGIRAVDDDRCNSSV